MHHDRNFVPSSVICHWLKNLLRDKISVLLTCAVRKLNGLDFSPEIPIRIFLELRGFLSELKIASEFVKNSTNIFRPLRALNLCKWEFKVS